MPKVVIQRGFYPSADFSRYMYFFKRSGHLHKRNRSTGKTTKLAAKLPERWKQGFFYVLNGRGDIVRSEMAPQF